MISMDPVAQSPYFFVQVSSDVAQLHFFLDVFQLLLQLFSLQLQLQIAVSCERGLLLLGLSELVRLLYMLLGHREEDVTHSLFKSVKQCSGHKLASLSVANLVLSFFDFELTTVFSIVGVIVAMLSMRALMCVVSDPGWTWNANMKLTVVPFGYLGVVRDNEFVGYEGSRPLDISDSQVVVSNDSRIVGIDCKRLYDGSRGISVVFVSDSGRLLMARGSHIVVEIRHRGDDGC